MKLSVVEQLRAAREAKAPVVLVTRIDDGSQRLLDVDRQPDDPLADSALEAVRTDRSLGISENGAEYFLQPFNPPVRLFVVGAVHIAQALVPMAQLAGYEVTVIDPRRAFASEDRFPGVNLVCQWPGEALAALEPDRRSAVVTLSHDPKIDDPALKTALATEAFYVGSLGSRRTHSGRLERLAAEGLTKAQLAHIHAPIGLDIGGRSPGEIAVSIVAEMTQTLRRGKAE
ncbi:XdhC family protein [Ectothiorhodospiraceae bacterium WFHF3C12]|nr:XdhC family protein [Ectothiorhodospiraceae bacterium WFHF3C12]